MAYSTCRGMKHWLDSVCRPLLRSDTCTIIIAAESRVICDVFAVQICRSSYLLKQRRVVADKLKSDSLVKHPASTAALIAASGTTAQGILTYIQTHCTAQMLLQNTR
jgi:hypothetical protein